MKKKIPINELKRTQRNYTLLFKLSAASEVETGELGSGELGSGKLGSEELTTASSINLGDLD